MSERFPSIRWGLSTLGCPAYSLPQVLELADPFGMEFLELRTLSGSGDIAETLYRPENIACARNIAEKGRCRVIDSTFHIALDSEDERRELCAVARTADDFGIPYIRVFGHFPVLPELTGEVLRTCAGNLRWFREQRFSAQLALETHDSFCQVRRVLALCDAYGSALPVVWDAHHTKRFAGEDLAESFRLLGKSIVSVHFKDSHFEGPERKYAGDLPGAGEMPLEELFTLLEENKVRCPVIFEYEKFWQPSLPPLEQALEAWNKIIRSI